MKKVIIISLIAINVALIAYGIVWWRGKLIKEEEVARRHREEFDAICKRQEAVKETLDRVNKNKDSTFKEFGDVLESQGIKRP